MFDHGWSRGKVAVVGGWAAIGVWVVATRPLVAAVVLALVVVGLFAAGALARPVRAWLREEGVSADDAVGWLVWNFWSGAPVTVGPALQDEATPSERAVARARRAAPRWAAAGFAGGAVYLVAGAPLGAAPWRVAALGLVVPPAVSAGVWAAVRAAAEWLHWRRWVLPLHLALYELLGYPPDGSTRYLTVPRGFAAEGNGVIVNLPVTWRYEERRNDLVFDLVRRKLALDDVSDHWVGTSGYGYLQVLPTNHAPPSAFFSDPAVREAVENAKPSAPLIGLGVGDRPVAFDLDSEAPHLVLSAGTGGGKSALIRNMAAQLLRNGSLVWVIDYKRHSQPWLRGLPGVQYLREPEDIHDALIALSEEARDRNKAWDDVPLGGKGPQYPRLVVICEEMNATFNMLRRYWQRTRPSGSPQMSPAIEGFTELLFMGRAVRVNVLAVTQMATAKDLGGPEARENFAVRILSRYTANAWKMLVPEIPYTPTSTIQGRVMVCRAGVATETQVVFFTDEEAREFAMSGRSPSVAAEGDATRLADSIPLGKHLASDATSRAGPAPGLSRGVTLREASTDGDGLIPIAHQALRAARSRDPEFPKPVGQKVTRGGAADTYDPDQLKRWYRNRPGTKGVARRPSPASD